MDRIFAISSLTSGSSCGLRLWGRTLFKELEEDNLVDSAKNIFMEAQMDKIQLSIHLKKRQHDLTKKATSRKRLRPSSSRLGFTKEQAANENAEKEKKAVEAEAKKIRNA